MRTTTGSLARLFAFASAASAVHAEGINCNGSTGACAIVPTWTAKTIAGYINGIDGNRWYNNGEHIACYAGICAFLQNTSGAPGKNIPALANYLIGHGCTVCGSVPYFYPSDNNVADGMLTFNSVTGSCNNGLC